MDLSFGSAPDRCGTGLVLCGKVRPISILAIFAIKTQFGFKRYSEKVKHHRTRVQYRMHLPANTSLHTHVGSLSLVSCCLCCISVRLSCVAKLFRCVFFLLFFFLSFLSVSDSLHLVSVFRFCPVPVNAVFGCYQQCSVRLCFCVLFLFVISETGLINFIHKNKGYIIQWN